jgi:replicative superfamily II helicase
MVDREVKAAIERAEQNLAYSRMTRRDDGYITVRPSDLEIFLRLARLASSPEMTAMKPSEQMIEAVARTIAATQKGWFWQSWTLEAEDTIESFLTAARAEGWVLCRPDDEISNQKAGD